MRQTVILTFVAALALGPTALGVDIETVPVGNPGNTGELSGEGSFARICGRVDYEYRIGKYEVTAGQYCEFLNAIAKTDTYGVYNVNMADTLSGQGCNIVQAGLPGSYSYSVAPDWTNRPVNYVGWGDAARFANWLHNGRPTGDQDLATTEDGAYCLNGATSHEALLAVVREDDWKWALPSEDEWYKAAYHKNDGVTSNYFDYPTSSDTVPSADLVDPDPGNNATFYRDGDVYTIGPPYYRTEAGAHENSESPYGTFDQGGNVWEWNEQVAYDWFRGLRGGAYAYHDYTMDASYRSTWSEPTNESAYFGLRVVEVPEPATLALLAVGAAALIGRSRRGR